MTFKNSSELLSPGILSHSISPLIEILHNAHIIIPRCPCKLLHYCGIIASSSKSGGISIIPKTVFFPPIIMSVHYDSIFLSVFYCGVNIAIKCVSNIQCFTSPSPTIPILVKKKSFHLSFLP